MTAREMINSLVAGQYLANTRKSYILSSLRKLAAALQVDLDDLDLSSAEATYHDDLKTYFAQLDPVPSVHTQRNTAQDLAQLYRAAHAAGILRPLALRPAKRLAIMQALKDSRRSSPYRVYTTAVLSRYVIPKEQWPSTIREPWEAYRSEKNFEIREATVAKYEQHFARYVSYNLAVEKPPIATWDQLFEVPRLRRFVQWLATRINTARAQDPQTPQHNTRITVGGYLTAQTIEVIAHYYHRPDYAALLEFFNKLPKPERMHHKTDPIHTISFRELEELGLRLLGQARQPVTSWHTQVRHIGAARAITCQTALLIRLWWRVPLRSRSMREMDMQLPGLNVPRPRLYQDDHGIWQLRYQGEQLKIGHRGNKPNEFHVPFPPDLVSHLEEYLRDFRPLIPNAKTTPYVFISRHGAPLSHVSIWARLSLTVYAALGKRLYPHLLRTMWTDAYLLASGGDIDTAAYMLNDTPQTVLKYYHELRADQQVVKAYAFNEAILGNGKRNGKAISP